MGLDRLPNNDLAPLRCRQSDTGSWLSFTSSVHKVRETHTNSHSTRFTFASHLNLSQWPWDHLYHPRMQTHSNATKVRAVRACKEAQLGRTQFRYAFYASQDATDGTRFKASPTNKR
ncbi:hypothetical protein RSOLAG1IB_11343 [Rhizoctonia solani AG-1 IB]|uniref:Uncharacterized protein n=1 Tax=Thanatephorus cucumeris (strain AG1-IB / isolate 7/3/14) TaxID=1108050 RepID=A0A0B7F5R0_THACB|nr:hypothetical protein RSOLAG1IB_11343 [Rhizoctonia solani AG-1 IB]